MGITEEMFASFVELRDSGDCNMMSLREVNNFLIMEITRDQHREMIRNFDQYAQEFGVGL